MITNDITMREMLNATIALLEGNTPQHNITPADVIAKARAEIAKLDATNAKRAEKAAEKAKENDPIKATIFAYLVENGTKTTAEVAAGISTPENEVSAPKASAMLRQMVEAGQLTASEVKVPKKGKQKAYTAVVPAE